ncbi:metalloreductase STEAP3-like isoform X3 [Salarias fasciatus]|uniref:metalloreductase STEAP3-like isoform X3 n=1 Tax=Salarias fasciatus TaxID=181472 RepID=UPI001176AEDA|nr:metalloreductase STEAP3-like isoform X3 [Salarias fasciatus]
MPDDMSAPLIRDRGPGGDSSASSEPGSPLIGILGTGDFSRSLARRLLASGYQVVVGSRNPKRSAPLFPEEVEVTSQAEAARRADLVFVAVFPEHHSTLAAAGAGLGPALAGKTLVDVSNGLQARRDGDGEGPSHAERLAALFPDSTVVKGFNTVSAWALQAGPRDGSRQVLLCSDCPSAKRSVKRICRRLGFTAEDAGPLSAAREVEDLPLRLFPAWRRPALCAAALLAFFYLYNALRDVVQPLLLATGGSQKRSPLYKLPVETLNASLPCAALAMLALVYAPGLAAAALQLRRGTKYRRFPARLDAWLRARKQLGLCAFTCAALHAVYSLLLPLRKSARYKIVNMALKQVAEGAELWDEAEVWRMELYLSAGVAALGLLSLLAVASLPSVSGAVNWREFSFVQSTLGYCALAAATAHTLLYGWDRAFDPAQYRLYLPPTFVLAVTPALAAASNESAAAGRAAATSASSCRRTRTAAGATAAACEARERHRARQVNSSLDNL